MSFVHSGPFHHYSFSILQLFHRCTFLPTQIYISIRILYHHDLFDHTMSEVQQAAYCPAFIDSVEVSSFIILTGNVSDMRKTAR